MIKANPVKALDLLFESILFLFCVSFDEVLRSKYIHYLTWYIDSYVQPKYKTYTILK